MQNSKLSTVMLMDDLRYSNGEVPQQDDKIVWRLSETQFTVGIVDYADTSDNMVHIGMPGPWYLAVDVVDLDVLKMSVRIVSLLARAEDCTPIR